MLTFVSRSSSSHLTRGGRGSLQFQVLPTKYTTDAVTRPYRRFFFSSSSSSSLPRFSFGLGSLKSHSNNLHFSSSRTCTPPLMSAPSPRSLHSCSSSGGREEKGPGVKREEASHSKNSSSAAVSDASCSLLCPTGRCGTSSCLSSASFSIEDSPSAGGRKGVRSFSSCPSSASPASSAVPPGTPEFVYKKVFDSPTTIDVPYKRLDDLSQSRL